VVTPVARRAAVTHAREAHEISERRACSIIDADRSVIRYRHRRADDAATRTRLKELAAERRRFGWRRLKLLLEREGIRMNHKKLRRLYAEERLQVRRRGGRKRALGTRAPMTLPQGPDQRWSLDFVSDTLTDGRRFRILVVVDDFTRECLCLVADTSLSGARVARELTLLIARRGARPLLCGSDNGTELGWRLGSVTTMRCGRTRHMAVSRRLRSGCRRARLRQARCAPASPVACSQA
jgi:putative transposase